MPPVSTILAAMLWLSARHRVGPKAETAHVLAQQAQRLAIHPQATPEDLATGLRLAGAACQDLLQGLTRAAPGAHH